MHVLYVLHSMKSLHSHPMAHLCYRCIMPVMRHYSNFCPASHPVLRRRHPFPQYIMQRWNITFPARKRWYAVRRTKAHQEIHLKDPSILEALPPMKPRESTRGKIFEGFLWKISLVGVSRWAAKETKACLEKPEVGPFDLSLIRWWDFFPDLLCKAEQTVAGVEIGFCQG